MKNFSRRRFVFLLPAALAFAACQPPTTTTNVNTNQTVARTENSNTENGSVNANSTSAAGNNSNENNLNNNATGATIEAGEPQQYQATVSLKLEAGGDNNGGQQMPALPKITAQVARSGDNRRMEFNMPSGEKVIYLDLGGKQFIVSPQRKQYGELNKESLGFDVRRLLMPSQIVSQVKAQKGVERVGEEKYEGRDAVKYGYSGVTDTKTKAGNVATQSVIYVDRETGLPLHSETLSESQNGAVNGLKSLRFVTEMTNLKTDADANLFKEPTDFQKVPPEQIRQQVDLIFNAIASVAAQALKTQTATNPSPTATP